MPMYPYLPDRYRMNISTITPNEISPPYLLAGRQPPQDAAQPQNVGWEELATTPGPRPGPHVLRSAPPPSTGTPGGPEGRTPPRRRGASGGKEAPSSPRRQHRTRRTAQGRSAFRTFSCMLSSSGVTSVSRPDVVRQTSERERSRLAPRLARAQVRPGKWPRRSPSHSQPHQPSNSSVLKPPPLP